MALCWVLWTIQQFCFTTVFPFDSVEQNAYSFNRRVSREENGGGGAETIQYLPGGFLRPLELLQESARVLPAERDACRSSKSAGKFLSHPRRGLATFCPWQCSTGRGQHQPPSRSRS